MFEVNSPMFANGNSDLQTPPPPGNVEKSMYV